MIEGWDRGPRDRSKNCHQIHESMDWIYRLGPKVVIEVRDLNGGNGRGDGADPIGVTYADLAIGEGPDAHRVPLGPVLYGDDEPWRSPINVPTIEDALRMQEDRGRKAAASMLEELSA